MAVVVAQTILFVIMISKRRWTQRPALFTFVGLRFAISYMLIVAVFLPSRVAAPVYFYLYWTAAAATCVIRVWMIVELGCAACYPAAEVRMLLARIVPSVAVFFFVASALLTVGESVQYEQVLAQLTIGLGRAIALTCLATFLVVAYACEFFGIKWGESDRKIALGLSLQTMSGALVSWILGIARPGYSTLLSDAQDSVYFLSLLLWSDALLRCQESESGLFSVEQLRDISWRLFRTRNGQRR
ncbi:MAG: hypothetical protein ACLGPM_07870 [Acidobacteriota bacterium]